MRKIPIENTGMIVTIIICCILALFIAIPFNNLLGFRLAACFGIGWAIGKNWTNIKEQQRLDRDALMDIFFGFIGGLVMPIGHGLMWIAKTYIVDYDPVV